MKVPAPCRSGTRGQNKHENASLIRSYYRTVLTAWGPQHWWPAHTPFEIIVGTFLTQNTAWTNVELALANLRAANLLSIEGIRRVPLPDLERMIRPSGYFRQKAQRLKAFVSFLDRQYSGSLEKLFAQPTNSLREELLSLNGVGPETADSILLYAGQHPVFVVDAYARRIVERHGIAGANTTYEELREHFEQALGTSPPTAAKLKAERDRATIFRPPPHPPSAMSLARRSSLAQVYNDMHGLVVAVGKHYCFKSKPYCEECPLR